MENLPGVRQRAVLNIDLRSGKVNGSNHKARNPTSSQMFSKSLFSTKLKEDLIGVSRYIIIYVS